MKNLKLTNGADITTLIIKNMVCDRCIKVVREELLKLKLDVRSIKLGEVIIAGDLNNILIEKIKLILEENGFELIEDKKARIIEQTKLAIIKLVREDADSNNFTMNYSEYLVNKINLDYHYLSTLFSSVENITIEQYIILQKIERAKELLKYGELTLSEIAYKLGYSSVQHLSNQFRKVTGLTASQFKSLTGNTRKSLDKVEFDRL